MNEPYARCKGCDSSFYPRWRARLKQFEELCDYCRQAATWAARVDPDLFRDVDNWNSEKDMTSTDLDQQYIHGLIQDYNPVNDDLYKEDEYTEYGEGAMGNLGLFDH